MGKSALYPEPRSCAILARVPAFTWNPSFVRHPGARSPPLLGTPLFVRHPGARSPPLLGTPRSCAILARAPAFTWNPVVRAPSWRAFPAFDLEPRCSCAILARVPRLYLEPLVRAPSRRALRQTHEVAETQLFSCRSAVGVCSRLKNCARCRVLCRVNPSRRAVSNAVNPPQAGSAAVISVETQNRIYPTAFHHCDMQRITR